MKGPWHRDVGFGEGKQMSILISDVGKYAIVSVTTKSWYEDIGDWLKETWDDITGTSEDAVTSVSVPSAATGCDCHGVYLIGDLDVYGDAEVETPIDTAGDYLSDDALVDTIDGDGADDGISECEWGKIGDDIRVDDDSARYSILPNMVWTGSEFGICWDGEGNIYFTRLDSNGNKIESDKEVTNGPEWSMVSSLAWTGSEYGVAWYDARDDFFDSDIYLSRLNNIGDKIGSDIRVTNYGGHSIFPSLTWTGYEYGMGWRDNRDGSAEIYFARLDGSGNKIGDDIRVTSDPAQKNETRLVWTGSEYGISWADLRNATLDELIENSEIYFARLDRNGNKIGDDMRVTNAIMTSVSPSLTWTGYEYGISWWDNRNGSGEIYFARLDGNGNKIGDDIRVISYDLDFSCGHPFLAWTGYEYGIIWDKGSSGNREMYFARLDSRGNKIGIDISITSYFYPQVSHLSLVWTGSEFGVGWVDERDGDGNEKIYFARIGCVPE
jgi:hypothetical protein